MKVRRGISRTVLLVGRYAVKVPSLRGHCVGGVRGRMAGFAYGLLHNQSEATWHTFEGWDGKVAPVLHSWLGGLVNVYPRCGPPPEDAVLFELDPCPGDIKLDNYGVLNGVLVRVDYSM
jgi:hypothetical protein